MHDEKSTFKSDYVPLNELVYAPLHAVSQSNMLLSGNILELINKTGEVSKGPQGEEIIHLKTINFAYEQIKTDEIDMQHIEEIELKVPLISIIPLSGLQVNNAHVKFNVEINGVIKQGEGFLFASQVSTSNERNSDHLPKFTYDIELKNTPCPEGLARLIDILDISQIPKKLRTKSIDDYGKFISEDCQEYYTNLKNLKKLENRLNKTCTKLTSLIEEKKRIFYNLMESQNLIAIKDYDEYASSSANEANLRELANENPKLLSILGLGCKIKNYINTYTKIEDKLQSISEQLLISEINNIEEGLYNE